VFDNAGIARRNVVAPLEWYEQPHGWGDRNAVYLEAAQDLFERAAIAAIQKAGLDPSEIDGVVTVSTTGIATPSLEARLGPKLGLRSDVRRVPVFGLGCAGGVNGLAIAGGIFLAVGIFTAAAAGSRLFWLVVLAALGGFSCGFGMMYSSAVQQWPILRRYINTQLVRDDAEQTQPLPLSE
jgi:hypothetical protein